MASGDLFGKLFTAFFRFGIVSARRPRHHGPVCADVQGGGRLAVVEFDDQGLCFEPDAMEQVQAELDTLEGRNPIIILFAHGWKHGAGEGDPNLVRLRELVAAMSATSSRPVLGVYLAWRGLSRSGNYLWEQSSFWDRREAAKRVANGSPRELLGRLKAFRNGPGGPGHPQAILIVVGHSFGGLIVYTAIAQSLIEAAASREDVVPSFGDLVLLVNPAFSAVSYLPIEDIVLRSHYRAEQFPVFVSVTAENDDATKIFYPLGSLASLLTEAWRTPHEREALIRTMGHLPWLRTHALSLAATKADDAMPMQALASLSGNHEGDPLPTQLEGVAIARVPGRKPSPFWVASATPDIIDGHNGIYGERFLAFVRALVDQAIQAAAGKHR